jgi:hypothetical protein
MQIALICGGDDKYDVFVRKFQPELEQQRDVLGAFFKRAFPRGQSRTSYDQYITQLADAESTYNLASGADFCSLSKGTLDRAMSLTSADDLAKFLAKVPVQQSMDFEACGNPGAPPVTPSTRPFRHRRKSHYHQSA